MFAWLLVISSDIVLLAQAARILVDYFGALLRFQLAQRFASYVSVLDVPISKAIVTPSGGVLDLGAVATAVIAIAIGVASHRMLAASAAQ